MRRGHAAPPAQQIIIPVGFWRRQAAAGQGYSCGSHPGLGSGARGRHLHVRHAHFLVSVQPGECQGSDTETATRTLGATVSVPGLSEYAFAGGRLGPADGSILTTWSSREPGRYWGVEVKLGRPARRPWPTQ